MASPLFIDLNSLLAPVSAESAVGGDIRLDTSLTSDYSRIRDARKAARAAERSNIFDNDNSAADEHWRTVLQLAPDILKGQAKDLEITSWYTEALVRRAGFQGLRDGFTLIRQLIEQYWDNLYPLPDEDGITTRVAALTGLNGEGAEGVLIAPMRSVAITQGSHGPYSYWQYKQALDAQRMADEQGRAELIAKNGFSLDDIQEAVDQSEQAFYIDLRDDVRDALDEYKRISRLLDEHCGIHDSPPASNITNTLGDILGAITHIARLKLPQAEGEHATGVDDSIGTGSATPGAAMGPVKSRDEAFRQLAQISQFFRQTEPHSPISYVIEKAVKWGNMPLGDLIQELIPDSSSRNTYSSLTGVKINED
jgi:type VI secretion system protein ImpA